MARKLETLPPLSRNIKRERERLRWTAQDLASAADVSLSTVSFIERGRAATSTTIQKLADALGVSSGDLLNGRASKRG